MRSDDAPDQARGRGTLGGLRPRATRPSRRLRRAVAPRRSSIPGAVAGLIGLVAVLGPAPALAGAPFLTNDPEPTDTGHWEIYAPQVDFAGRGDEFAGTATFEFNYGAAPGLQLTVGIPIAFAQDSEGLRAGSGDLQLSTKYQLYRNEKAAFSVATFPAITVPTGSRRFTAHRVTALLPIWAQKDWGAWSAFGGGGYNINPGAGNRDFWSGGIALTRQVDKRLLLGVEAARQGADSDDGRASTTLDFGVIRDLRRPFRVLASAGPTFDDGGGRAGYHGFVALALEY